MGLEINLTNLTLYVHCLPILTFHNPCDLIWFKCDSRLRALHSGRWVDKLVFMHAAHNFATHIGTLTLRITHVVLNGMHKI